MTRRSLTLLAAVTVLLTAAALAAWVAGRQTGGSAPGRGEALFPALSAPETRLRGLEITTPGYALVLKASGTEWLAVAHGDYPVPAERVNRLVTELAALRRWEPKTSRPERYAMVGVEDVAAEGAEASLLRLTGEGEAALAEIIVGKRSTSMGANRAGGTFVRHPAQAQTWLVEGTLTLPGSLGEWIGPVLHIPGPEIRAISISEGEGVTVTGAKPPNGARFQLESATPTLPLGTLINDQAFKAIAQAIVSLSVTDVRLLSAVSFAAGDRVVRFETIGGLMIEARLGTAEGKSWVAFRAEPLVGADKTPAETINARTAQWAFLLDYAKLDALRTPLGRLFATSGLPAQ